MTFLELPRFHDRLAQEIVRATGVPPSTCPGEMARVDERGNTIDLDAGPFLDASTPMEGRPNSFAPVRFLRCLECRQTEVIEECVGPDGETFFRSRNRVGEDHGRRAAARPVPLASIA